MGLVGTGNSTNKFCISKECKIAKNENQKFGFKPGLFIRVPKKGDQVYCSPPLQEEFLESDLIGDFITELKNSTGMGLHLCTDPYDWNKNRCHGVTGKGAFETTSQVCKNA